MNQDFPVNFYKLLQIDPGASQGEIKKAFRRLSKMHHPDVKGQEAGNKQQLLNQAMAVLSHPEKRREHDVYWGQRSQSNTPGLPEDFNHLVKLFRDHLRKALVLRESLLRGSRMELAKEIISQLKRDSIVPRLWPSIFSALIIINIILGFLYYPVFAGLVLLTPFLIISLKRGARGKMSFFHSVGNGNAIQSKAEIMAEARIERKINRLETYTEYMDLLLAIFRRSFLKQEPRDMMVKICLGFLLQGYRPVKFDHSQNILGFTNHQNSLLVKIEHPRSPEQANQMYQSLNKQMVEEKILRGYIFYISKPAGDLSEKAKPRGIQLHDQRQSTLWLMEIARNLPSEPDKGFLENLKEMTIFVKKLYR